MKASRPASAKGEMELTGALSDGALLHETEAGVPRQTRSAALHEYLSTHHRTRILGYCLLVFICLLCILAGSGATNWRQSLTIATAVTAALSWADVRGLAMELTSVLVLTLFTVTKTLTFEQALAGAASPAIWLIWVGAAVGSTIRVIKADDFLVSLIVGGPESSFGGMCMRASLLTLCCSVLMPSATARTMMFAPLCGKISTTARLDERQTEALSLLITVSVSKLGLGLLTSYLSPLAVSHAYEEVMDGSSVEVSRWIAAGEPSRISWGGYASHMFIVWTLLQAPTFLLTMRLAYGKSIWRRAAVQADGVEADDEFRSDGFRSAPAATTPSAPPVKLSIAGKKAFAALALAALGCESRPDPNRHLGIPRIGCESRPDPNRHPGIPRTHLGAAAGTTRTAGSGLRTHLAGIQPQPCQLHD